jgi:hypothetical protein
MNILFWDIENIKYIKKGLNKLPTIDLIHCAYAKPFSEIEKRIEIEYKTVIKHQLESRGPDLADFHILALLHELLISTKDDQNLNVYLLTKDKLLTYRFIVLARSLKFPLLNIHTDLESIQVRYRSKLGANLFEEGDIAKLPKSINLN